MNPTPSDYEQRLRRVNVYLQRLSVGHVFVGGSAAGALLSDPAAYAVRATLDIDAVLEATSRRSLDAAQESLLAAGWLPDTSPGAPICRWITPDGDLVDLMPSSPDVLGFANPWYPLALQTRIHVETSDGAMLPIVWAPVFVLTKLVAFEDRGRGDLLASHDLEDLVTVFDGRPELDAEMLELPGDARAYAAEAFERLLAHPDLRFALPGHVDPTSDTEYRAGALLKRWHRLHEALTA